MITIAGYEFEGTYESTEKLKDQSGVYSILDKRDDGKFYMLDVGESDGVKTRVENHDRSNCWETNVKGKIVYAGHYVDEERRKTIEQKIRGTYSMPCGKK